MSERDDWGIDVPDDGTPGSDAYTGRRGEQVEPLPDEDVLPALRGDPEATRKVEEGWEQAGSMEGDAPTG